VRLAGLPAFWLGAGLERFSLPPGLLQRARSYLAVLADLEARAQDAAAAGNGGGGAGGGAAAVRAAAAAGGGGAGGEGVVALLQGQTVALLLKEFGSKLGAGGAGGPGAPRPAAPAAPDAPAGRGGGSAVAGAGGAEAERLQCLRALMVLVELLDGCLGSHALQVGAGQRRVGWLTLAKGLNADKVCPCRWYCAPPRPQPNRRGPA
jgi:hypothetical protein